MARNKLTPLQRKVVPGRIYRLICAGFNQPQVMVMVQEEFDVEMTQQNISRYFLRESRREGDDTAQERKKALARYEWGMSEAAEAWNKSKAKLKGWIKKTVREKESEKNKEGSEKNGGKIIRLEASEKTEEFFGDPRYLSEHRGYSDLHDKITGVRAPEKHATEVTGKVIVLPDNKRGDSKTGTDEGG